MTETTSWHDFMTSRSLCDLAPTGEGIPEDDDPEMLASGPSDRIPSELAEGTTLTLDEPDEDIRPDQGDEGSRGRRIGKAETKAKKRFKSASEASGHERWGL
ncbi:hypothetical protein BHE74_00059710 [Ensete ventricosum]|nr:hypothetical protein BHE74_00059710 [Ensete ventricosum]RZS19332.1 hypothetical protein BHM03_00051715 [Ensete ventricosum]